VFDLDFSPPEGLNRSLWRSLLINFADRFAPERLPPLILTSKPVDVGLLPGELLELPWYRTVFGNLADVISPETCRRWNWSRGRSMSANCWATN
jgi:hypothetical protein